MSTDEVKNNDVVVPNETDEVTSDNGAKELIKAVVEEAKEQKEIAEAKEVYDSASLEQRAEIDATKESEKEDEKVEGGNKKDEEVVEEDVNKVSDSEVKEDSSSKKVEGDKTPTKLDEMNLPGRLIQAAHRNHLTDDEIINLGDRAVPFLSKLADTLDGASQALGEAGRKYRELLKTKSVTKEDKKSTPLKFTDEEIEQNPVLAKVQSILDANQEKIDNLETALKQKESNAVKETLTQQKAQIDVFFDEVSETFPELGNSKSLTQTQMILRDLILDDVDNIRIGATLNGSEKTLDEALGEALSIYEGKNPRKVEKIRQDIIDDVKKRESQHIHRPSTKKASENLLSEHDKAVAAAAKVLRDRGLETF